MLFLEQMFIQLPWCFEYSVFCSSVFDNSQSCFTK
uniref:Uncharacterized protein n=1 Tax=Arundo donax TaxID=35708 RepID=A0A0A9GL65_ARUDO